MFLPKVETLGYSQSSLRDESGIAVKSIGDAGDLFVLRVPERADKAVRAPFRQIARLARGSKGDLLYEIGGLVVLD